MSCMENVLQTMNKINENNNKAMESYDIISTV